MLTRASQSAKAMTASGQPRCFRPKRHRHIFPQLPESLPKLAAAGELHLVTVARFFGYRRRGRSPVCKKPRKGFAVCGLGRNAEKLAAANHAAGLGRANQIKGFLAELTATGLSTREIAQERTARRIATPLGGRWHPQTLKRVMGASHGSKGHIEPTEAWD